MTETFTQKELNHSGNSRKDIRNSIKLYKEGIKRLKHISERVNNHGREERSQQEFQELHDVMSLIKEANRLITKIQNILKYIKENKKDHPSRLGNIWSKNLIERVKKATNIYRSQLFYDYPQQADQANHSNWSFIIFFVLH
jgi:ribosomal protein S15P/S13E